MKNRFELKSFIRSFKEIDFSLSRKDNQKIEGYVINRLEELIKELKAKMQERQEELYAKFASLESSMNTLNSQMNYLINSMSS